MALVPMTEPATTHVQPAPPRRLTDPAYQAFVLLWVGFTVAPILFGLDKFFDVLVDWRIYLAPEFDDLLPGNAHQILLGAGVVEIVAGLLIAARPRVGGYVVAAWLAGIIVNLLLQADYYDIALRDFGLMLGALTLARLATAFPGTPTPALQTTSHHRPRAHAS
jgi:hypothetical protein